MKQYRYDVCLKTPIGIRLGTLCVTALSNVLKGNLWLLSRVVPVTGRVDAQGNCHLSGNLITPIQTIPFAASGKLSRHGISLLLHSGQGEFELSGVASPGDAECGTQ